MLKAKAQNAAGREKERSALENLQNLAGLLKSETDRRSRQVILAETARMLAELEEQLKVKAS